MSAFIVEKRHIDALVEAALKGSRYSRFSYFHEGARHEVNVSNANEVGSMLWAENVRSVEFRYSGSSFDELPGSLVEVQLAPGVEPVMMPEYIGGYEYRRVGRQLSPVEVLKAIDCYEYQSCEHDDWQDSPAFAFCRDLRGAMIGNLPGYEEAKWAL